MCFSGFTLSWWRRVLEQAPIMPDGYGEIDEDDIGENVAGGGGFNHPRGRGRD